LNYKKTANYLCFSNQKNNSASQDRSTEGLEKQPKDKDKVMPKNKKIIFTGHFVEWFLMNLGLTFLSFITFGIGFFYQIWWNQKYLFTNLEIER